MKKNAMLKIAAVLLVAVLLTTCAISSTFAKYVTAAKDYEDSARVAKWGITSDTTINGDLFKKEYTHDGKSVKATTDVIAPGTSGQVSIVNVIAGTSEVTGRIEYTPDCAGNDTLLSRINLQYSTDNSTWTPVTTISQLNSAIDNFDADIKPGVAADATKALYIKWQWDFEADAEKKADTDKNGIDDYDDFDNELAKNAESNVIQIKFTVDITQTGPAVNGAN